MRKVLLAVLALVVLLPIIEWVLLIQLARVVTWWGVLALLAVAAVAGLALARRYGPSAWRQVKAGRTPATLDEPELLGMPSPPPVGIVERSTADRVLLTVAGLLLLFPGVLSDVVGLLLLVPAVRARILDTVLPRLAQRAQRAMLRSLGIDDELAGMFMSGGAFGSGAGAPYTSGGAGPGAGFDPAFGPGSRPGAPGAGPTRTSGRPGAGAGDVIDV